MCQCLVIYDLITSEVRQVPRVTGQCSMVDEGSGSGGPSSSLSQGHCVLLLGKTLDSHNATF